MGHSEVDWRLGTQLWFEQDDDMARVSELVSRAAQVGFGQARIFLMWPWIQPHSADSWDWRLWDDVFDAAETAGIGIKATLTANSGPWWLGTGSVLHSHTLTLDERWIAPAEDYVRTAVERYGKHPALSQWILWNEPGYPFEGESSGLYRPVGAREAWTSVLKERYREIERLNERWRTGFSDFDEVPFVEQLVHPAHAAAHWHSWRPYMDDAELRAALLEGELRRLAAIVRHLDPSTPLCVNPNRTLNNHAHHGLRLDRMAEIVDVLGASFHAPWSFADFATVDDHSSLVVAGLRLLQNTPNAKHAEVTEAQTGNTFYAGVNPLGVGRAEIASTYLAPLLAGADSVTGWCFNTRRQDFEAGEWGLLDDQDQIGERARAVTSVRTALSLLDSAIGEWQPTTVDAAVIASAESQDLQFVMAQQTDTPWSTRADAGIQGGALAALELDRLGVPATIANWKSPAISDSALLVALHCIAWTDDNARTLLIAAERGATVLIDGTSGQFDADASLHRPWPGALATQIGLTSRGLETSVTGKEGYEVLRHGHPAGRATGVRSAVEVSGDWSPVAELVYAHDFAPVLWERGWGTGRILYCTASLATSLLGEDSTRAFTAAVLAIAGGHIRRSVRPLSPATTVLEVEGTRGSAWGVFGPEISRRHGRPMAIMMPPGQYRDLWTGALHDVRADGLTQIGSPDGIALLVDSNSNQ